MKESLIADAPRSDPDRCFCPHTGPHCHGDHGCCAACGEETDRNAGCPSCSSYDAACENPEVCRHAGT